MTWLTALVVIVCALIAASAAIVIVVFIGLMRRPEDNDARETQAHRRRRINGHER